MAIVSKAMPNVGRRFCCVCQVFVCLLLPTDLAWAAEGSNNELIEFEISQRDAVTALNEIAKQARVQMLFDYEIVEDIQTNEINGSYSTWDALLLLVEDTGLQPVRIDDNIYSVVPGNNSARKSEDMINNKNLLGSALAVLSMGAQPVVQAREGMTRALEEIVVTA